MPANRSLTLADVAALAGVSPATVTRALNGHPAVRPETRARVEAAATALGYVPDLGARALAKGRSRTIGLLIPSSRDGFWGSVTEGLEARAAEAGFATLLAASHSDPDRERAMIELFLGKRVDGIVVGSAAGASWTSRRPFALPMVLVSWDAVLGPELMAAAITDPIPDVLARIRARTHKSSLAHVYTDDVDGAEQATRHLLALGHRRIAFAGLRPVRPAVLRLLGFRSALADAGHGPSLILESAASLEGGMEAGRQLLEAHPRPTAVVAFDDMVGVGIIRAAHARGLRVPDDLSVVGFDDVAIAAFVEPPLTTVAQDKPQLGSLAVDVILARLEGRASSIDTALPGQLVIRQSTGRCPGDQDPA
jgi:DNA-binding LacI/PurR family transcriptional regulator